MKRNSFHKDDYRIDRPLSALKPKQALVAHGPADLILHGGDRRGVSLEW